MRKILIIDDEAIICEYLKLILSDQNYQVEYCLTGTEGLKKIERQKYDLIISDYKLPDTSGLRLLKKIKKRLPSAPVIFITGYSDVRSAVEVIKAGGYNYLTKPLVTNVILTEVKNALSVKSPSDPAPDFEPETKQNITPSRTEKSSNQTLSGTSNSDKDIIFGTSDKANTLIRQINLVAPTNYSVVIYGESGTGKEAIATTIHKKSKRSNKPFVAVDCGSLTKELARSEFFGHEKGSFTGALGVKKGYFELAHGGTLFLDEITNLHLEIQALLLRAIQERKVFKIGSQKEIPVDIRILVASNKKLEQAVSEGLFREDLYHRLNEFSLDLKPIRELPDDLVLYANLFLEQSNREIENKISGFSDEVLETFQAYHWPGNLRELKNVIKRAVLLCSDNLITLDAIPKEIRYQSRHNHYKNLQSASNTDADLKSAAISAEKKKIIEVLNKVKFNKTKAAKLLEIDRKTLYNKIKDYDLGV